jgi:hypothetical protein
MQKTNESILAVSDYGAANVIFFASGLSTQLGQGEAEAAAIGWLMTASSVERTDVSLQVLTERPGKGA